MVVVLVVVVAGAGGVGVRVWSSRQARAQYLAAVAEVSVAAAAAREAGKLATATVDDFGAEVAEVGLVEDLGVLLDRVQLEVPVSVEAAEGLDRWSTARTRRITRVLAAQAVSLGELSEALVAGREAVRVSHEAWVLDQARAQVTDAAAVLAGDLVDARALLTASEGQVSDGATRESLTEAIDAGDVVYAQVTDVASQDSVSELSAAATTVQDAVAVLGAAVQAVEASQADWQAAQDAQAAAAAATAAGSSGSGSSGSTSSGGSSSSGSTSSSGTGSGSSSGSGSSGSETTKAFTSTRAASDGTPGAVTVSASTSGITGPVHATVGGVSAQMSSTGSGTWSVTLTGLAAGSYSWSVSGDGLTAAGSGTITVF